MYSSSPISYLSSSVIHYVHAISVSCILITSTWFSSGIRPILSRLAISISHCSVSSGDSVPVKKAGCSISKSETFAGQTSSGITFLSTTAVAIGCTLNKPSFRIIVYSWWICIKPRRNSLRLASSLLEPLWPGLVEVDPVLLPQRPTVMDLKGRNKEWISVQDHNTEINQGSIDSVRLILIIGFTNNILYHQWLCSCALIPK